MSEEEKVAAAGQETVEGGKKEVTAEIKVQAQDLFKTINGLIREGTVRRVMVIRNERTLVDIPLWAGIGSGVLLAVYMAPIAALVSVGALLGGCTVRIVREQPKAEE